MQDFYDEQTQNQIQTTYSTNSEKIRHYDIPANPNYLHNPNINSDQINLETIIKKNYPQNNIINEITKEKLTMLRATIELIKQLLNNRTQSKNKTSNKFCSLYRYYY
jgi:hypothetical protein